MTTFTLIVTGADGHQHSTLSDFPDPETAVGDTRHVVTADHPSIAVARGSGEDIEYLGV